MCQGLFLRRIQTRGHPAAAGRRGLVGPLPPCIPASVSYVGTRPGTLIARVGWRRGRIGLLHPGLAGYAQASSGQCPDAGRPPGRTHKAQAAAGAAAAAATTPRCAQPAASHSAPQAGGATSSRAAPPARTAAGSSAATAAPAASASVRSACRRGTRSRATNSDACEAERSSVFFFFFFIQCRLKLPGRRRQHQSRPDEPRAAPGRAPSAPRTPTAPRR